MTRPAVAASDSLAINGVLVSARQAIDIICDRWTLSIVLALLLGARRFKDLTKETGMASRLLVARIEMLEENGIITRIASINHPMRPEYELTDMGLDLMPVVLQMERWERAWVRPRVRPSATLARLLCGGPLLARVCCRSCGRAAGARDIALRVNRAQLRKVPDKRTQHRRSIVSSESSGGTHLLGQSLDIFGDKWGIEILLCAFFRIRRFNDFRQAIGITANILSDRLERLVDAGLLAKGRDVDSPPGYWLTEKGIDVYAIVVSIHEWADKWVRSRYKSPVALIHIACGKPFLPNLF